MTTARLDPMAARKVTSASNPAVREARRLLRRGPHGSGAFLVEGPQAVREAVGRLERLFATAEAAHRDADILDAAAAGGADVIIVPTDVLASLSTTVTPQGLVAVATLEVPDARVVLASADLIVACVEARDPGNVGAIVRTADAAGAGGVVLVGDCVDPRNAKAVRASAGSLFHVPVARELVWSAFAQACRDAGLRIVAADAGAATRHTAADLTQPTVLVFGSEAHGLPVDVLADCDETVAVPMYGRAESLNLAATVAILVYEAARQRDGRGDMKGAGSV